MKRIEMSSAVVLVGATGVANAAIIHPNAAALIDLNYFPQNGVKPAPRIVSSVRALPRRTKPDSGANIPRCKAWYEYAGAP